METYDHLSVLSQTIAAHAKELAYKEWATEYREILAEILSNAKIDVLAIGGFQIPVETLTKSIREEFVQARTKELTTKLTEQIVEQAFRKVLDEEQHGN